MYKQNRRISCAVSDCPTMPYPKAVKGRKLTFITCSEHRAHEEEAKCFYRALRHQEGAHQIEKMEGCELCHPIFSGGPEQLALDILIQQQNIHNICGCQGGGQ
jgi:hypothetical protein